MIERPTAIVITLSQSLINERLGGYAKILREWKDADGEKSCWWYKMGNAPRHAESILWVYWVVKGRIRWRCRLLEVVKDRHMTFTDGRTMYAKTWLVLMDFEPIPRRHQVELKGFQGFRYHTPYQEPITTLF